jgi:hypothetical protein
MTTCIARTIYKEPYCTSRLEVDFSSDDHRNIGTCSAFWSLCMALPLTVYDSQTVFSLKQSGGNESKSLTFLGLYRREWIPSNCSESVPRTGRWLPLVTSCTGSEIEQTTYKRMTRNVLETSHSCACLWRHLTFHFDLKLADTCKITWSPIFPITGVLWLTFDLGYDEPGNIGSPYEHHFKT